MIYQSCDILSENRADNLIPRHRLSNADKIFARSIAKRQLLVIKDLMSLDKTYPSLIDKDITGGLYALYTLLEDNVESIVSR